MSGANLIDWSGEEGEFPEGRVRRWIMLTIWLTAAFALFVNLWDLYSTKFGTVTGEAEWIWVEGSMKKKMPAVFFATRNFVVPDNAEYVRVKVAADPQYVLFLNGAEIGRGGTHLTKSIDRYEVDHIVAPGLNRIVISVRSSSGAGGLLASVDFGPTKQNMIVSDREWLVYREWSQDLLRREAPDLKPEKPRVIGRPPSGSWNFLLETPRDAVETEEESIEPKEVSDLDGLLPDVRVLSGVAVAGTVSVPATAFDFGPIRGRVRIEPLEQVKTIRVRFGSTLEDIQQIGYPEELVIAQGEAAVITTAPRDFRFVAVYGVSTRVTVLRERRE